MARSLPALVEKARNCVGHLGAHEVHADVVAVRVATAVARESGQRIEAAGLELGAEDVAGHAGSVPDDGQRGGRAEDRAGDRRGLGVGVEAQAGQTVEQLREHDARLHAREVQAEAHVRAPREREVLARRPEDVELLGRSPRPSRRGSRSRC